MGREMVSRLEQQELDCQTAAGTVPPALYTELLAAYLAQGELTKAKFLWKRIPATIKQEGELPRVWAVGKAMWAKDSNLVYSGLGGEWSPEVGAMVARVKANYQEDSRPRRLPWPERGGVRESGEWDGLGGLHRL